MDAQTLIMKRTGMSSEDASFYEEYSETAIRSYLHLEADADLSVYLFTIVDLAVVYWQRDQATTNSASTLGYNSRSFSEGGVSESVSGATGSSVYESYQTAIDDILAGLDGSYGRTRFI